MDGGFPNLDSLRHPPLVRCVSTAPRRSERSKGVIGRVRVRVRVMVRVRNRVRGTRIYYNILGSVTIPPPVVRKDPS